jgi:hypothetical protein
MDGHPDGWFETSIDCPAQCERFFKLALPVVEIQVRDRLVLTRLRFHRSDRSLPEILIRNRLTR